MSSTNEFEIDGTKFQIRPLKLKQQQKGLALVTHAILPAIVGGSDGKMDPVTIAQAVERLPELFDIFAAVAKVDWQGRGYVDLAAFAENVFERRPDLYIAFIAECVATEYSAFLSGSGRTVLEAAANRFASLLA